VIGRVASGPLRRGRRRILLGLLALCVLPSVAEAREVPFAGARLARASQPRCLRGSGVSKRECPKLTARPRLISRLAGVSLSPVLVGNAYAVEGGRWVGPRSLHLSVEWRDSHGRSLSRATSIALTPALAGSVITARVCARSRLAANCVALGLPGPVRTVAQYVQASCGAHRPVPPAYDPGFVLLSAPQVALAGTPAARTSGRSTRTVSRRSSRRARAGKRSSRKRSRRRRRRPASRLCARSTSSRRRVRPRRRRPA
jgi:hypothetical protein